MSVVFILVFAAIIMASAFLIAFIWAVRNGQFDDTYTPSVRILFDDPAVKEAEKAEQKESKKGQMLKQVQHDASSIATSPPEKITLNLFQDLSKKSVNDVKYE